MIRLGTMAGGYMPGVRTGIPKLLRGRTAELKAQRQKINNSK